MSVTGIGLEVHESPYLTGGTDDVILTGHTFSDEPGIYIEGKVRNTEIFVHISLKFITCIILQVGVRLEDCFYVDKDGRAKYLTEGVGGAAIDPWHI